ncbi:iron-sulfur cluster repair di-iron protein [Alkalicoccus daliensis]|uniref:Regulator of cell morphogenesis and NO signaling n=1 Tax=Alkalicoccus daliensis TaxID=745820 RepID=A0A1H0HBW2_9BACI|nr:iron-sulfur cluster repair di-iron protein [Alkalicoccus daliensis]SDO16371.1 regulator of cell morphogenesis and NO signaling [Alkalicoccus daliensis]
MEKQFTLETKTGDIVTQFPKASFIFKENKIDFCCGGNRPFGEALAEKGLDKEEILGTINELYASVHALEPGKNKWAERNFGELVDHIIDRHHGYLYQVLPELTGYVGKVYRVHGGNQPHLAIIYKMFNQLKEELLHHLEAEEKQLFPLVKQYEEDKAPETLQKLLATLEELEEEHEHAGQLLAAIREAANDYNIPEGACNTYQLTYLKLEELESDMFDHIHLENNILFPRLAEEQVS